MSDGGASESTRRREAFFLDFAERVRAVTTVPLMVTGGFRTAAGMTDAITSGATDLIGIARPLALQPELPAALWPPRTPPAPTSSSRRSASRSSTPSPTCGGPSIRSSASAPARTPTPPTVPRRAVLRRAQARRAQHPAPPPRRLARATMADFLTIDVYRDPVRRTPARRRLDPRRARRPPERPARAHDQPRQHGHIHHHPPALRNLPAPRLGVAATPRTPPGTAHWAPRSDVRGTSAWMARSPAHGPNTATITGTAGGPRDDGATPIAKDEPMVVLVHGIVRPRHLKTFLRDNVHAASRARHHPGHRGSIDVHAKPPVREHLDQHLEHTPLRAGLRLPARADTPPP